LAAKGNLSSDQIDQAMEIAKKYGVILGTFGTMIVYTILGVIFGLIGAAIFKKEHSAYDPEPETTDPAA
jgi:cytochrome bd-type quinol oxidase subunit 1